jgi:disulfide bond formation protein DsbB
MSVDTLSTFFALLALGCNLVVVGALGLWVAARFSPAVAGVKEQVLASIRGQELTMAWLIALASTLGSLYYSEIAHFEPCRYCWYQRIAMYPLAVILGMAAWKKDLGIRIYASALAGIGGLIAAYHYLIQVFPTLSSGECSVGVPCTARYVEKFGFVSIPWMALAGFSLILVLLAAAGSRDEDDTPVEQERSLP